MSVNVRVRPRPKVEEKPTPVEVVVKKYDRPEVSEAIKNLHKKIKTFKTGFKDKEILKKAIKAMGFGASEGYIGNDTTGLFKVSIRFTQLMGFEQVGDEIILFAFEKDERKLNWLITLYNYFEIKEDLLRKGYNIKTEKVRNKNLHLILEKDGEEIEVIVEGVGQLIIHSKNFENHKKCKEAVEDALEDKDVEIISEEFTDEIKSEYEEEEEPELEIEEEKEWEEHREDERQIP